jgi:hypothetical protein
MLRTNLKPWLALTHFLMPAQHWSLHPRTPNIVHLLFFVCNLCPPPLSQFHDQTKLKFQEFNTMSIWVLLLRDSCKPMLLCIEQRVGCFVNWIFSPFCFWVIWTVINHRLQMASWPSKFIWVRCRIRWCWMLENWIFSFLAQFVFLGHLRRWSEAPNGRLTKQSKSNMSQVWDSMTHSNACKWVVDGYGPPRQQGANHVKDNML